MSKCGGGEALIFAIVWIIEVVNVSFDKLMYLQNFVGKGSSPIVQ